MNTKTIGGLFFAVVGVMMITGVFSSARHERITKRLALVGAGFVGVTFGVFHFTEGMGFAWTDPEPRGTVFLLAFLACMICWLFVWMTRER